MRRLATENILLKEELAPRRGAPQIIGEDAKLKQVTVALHRAAATDATVLLEGESGTGKELFARALHALSPRADGPFVAINCAAIPENLLETELFGYEKGAFTGAAQRKPGKFELAHRGTLFLDEIGELPLALQAEDPARARGKTLRAGRRHRAAPGRRARRRGDQPQPEGRGRGAPVSARICISGCRCFRSSFRRCASAPSDIPMLAKYFIERFCRELNKKPRAHARAVGARSMLVTYPWRGNVRELQNCIERAVILTEGDTHSRAPSQSVVCRDTRRCTGRVRRRESVVGGSICPGRWRMRRGGSSPKSSAGRSPRRSKRRSGNPGLRRRDSSDRLQALISEVERLLE